MRPDCADIWHLVGQDGNRLGAGDGVADVFASPVEVSDVVFIREPWYRLKNPQGGESERVILAADSVVQPEQAAYKWASRFLCHRTPPPLCAGKIYRARLR